MEASIRYNRIETQNFAKDWYSADAKWSAGETWQMDGNEIGVRLRFRWLVGGSNYNLRIALFFAGPAIIGVIGLIVSSI